MAFAAIMKTMPEKISFYHSEACYGSFRRVIPLPEGVDSEHVDAQYANGILTLKLQKTPATAAKKIEIKVKD
jgi:HSP20 family protein